jgi:DnaJ-class molecular chaperone|tara:strand:- start:233 stop:478 length:246 start_codon:yes stop_codon:yes gene_type:complete
MIESGTEMGIYQIDIPCADCEGTGHRHHQVAPDAFQRRVCDVCHGDGFNTHEAAYDSIADADVDYPNAIEIREIIQRGGGE